MIGVARMEISVRDIDRVRLLAYELKALGETMQADRCPHAPAMKRIVDRFTKAKERDDR